MNPRKNNNSVHFLATLGVYLGLVLAGATPQVLASAAMTRSFDVKDEIEFTDNLDKKPGQNDDLEKDLVAVDHLKIAEAISGFIANLKKLESIGKFNVKEDLVFSQKLCTEEYETTALHSKNSDISNRWVESAVEELISKAEYWDTSSIADWLPAACEGRNCKKSSIEVISTSNDFILRFGFEKSSPEAAKLAAERFTELFSTKIAELRKTRNLPVYKGISCLSENNQVFIVTRLPRAGLDSLLLSEAK